MKTSQIQNRERKNYNFSTNNEDTDEVYDYSPSILKASNGM